MCERSGLVEGTMIAVQSRPRLLKRVQRDEQGSILAWTALGIASLLGMAALTVDMGYMYVLNNQLQTTADAAASAAVKELPDEAGALLAAQDIVQKNMPSSAHGNVITAADVQFGNWNSATRTFTDAGSPLNAVRVNTRRDSTNNNAARTFFASALGFEDVSIGAQAIALQGEGGGPACLISLEASADNAFNMNSNAQIDVTGCGVYVNSTHSSALSLSANAFLHADSISVAGGFDDGVNTDVDPQPKTGALPTPDPLASLQQNLPTRDGHNHNFTSAPSQGTGNPANYCDFTNRTLLTNQFVTLNPGIYCGGLELRSNSGAVLNPGMYVMKPSTTKAGKLLTNSNTSIAGTGVFMYLTGSLSGVGSVIDLNANSTVNLTAPTDPNAPVVGPYAGVVFFQDPNLVGQVNRLRSNSNKRYVGAVYLPTNDVLIDSNGEINTNSNCSVFIARRFQFDSNARFTGTFNLTQDCPTPLANALDTGGSTTTTLVK